MFRLTYQVKNSSGYIYRGLPVIEDEATAKKRVDELDKKWPELKHSYEWVPDPTHAAG